MAACAWFLDPSVEDWFGGYLAGLLSLAEGELRRLLDFSRTASVHTRVSGGISRLIHCHSLASHRMLVSLAVSGHLDFGFMSLSRGGLFRHASTCRSGLDPVALGCLGGSILL